MAHEVAEIDTVIGKCNGIVADKKYSRHRFVIDFDGNPPDRPALGRWALQKYHQVYMQNRIFSIIHAKTDFEDVRQFMMEQLIAEETPINCGSDSHYNLMRRFAAACFVMPDQFVPETMAPEVGRYVGELLAIMREEHFAVALLTIYAIECQSGESVGRLLRALKRHYDFSEAELEWFAVHSEEDDDHAEQGVVLVRKYGHLVSDFEQAATRAVNRICDAWLTLHDFYFSALNLATATELAQPS
jgi:pyrroloquinoline-quinone synthase